METTEKRSIHHDYEDLDNFPAKDWEEGEFCAVCHNGGEFVGCDRCPRVYHLECYIPELTAEPADGWICLLCRSKKEFEKLSNDSVRLGGNMAKRDRQVCVRLLFEVYNVYPASTSFKSVKALDFHQYRTVINKPIALDVIKSKLDIDHTDAYMSVADFVSDIRLMFQNCRTFWKTFTGGDIYIEHATNLWSHFEKLWKDWKFLTSHQNAPAFIIAPYEKKKPVSHSNFPKVKDSKKKAQERAYSGQPRTLQTQKESPRKPGPAYTKRPGPASSKGFEGLETKKRLDRDESDPLYVEDTALSSPYNAWQCNYCDVRTENQLTLKNHTLTHYESQLASILPDTKPFICPETDCNRKFGIYTSLMRHYGFDHYGTEEDFNGTAVKNTNKDKIAKGKDISSKNKQKSKYEESSDEDTSYPRNQRKNDYNNNDNDSRKSSSKKKKRSINEDGSAESSEDDYDPGEDQRELSEQRKQKKNKSGRAFDENNNSRKDLTSAKSSKHKKNRRENDSDSDQPDDDDVETYKQGRKPGPASSKRPGPASTRKAESRKDSEGGSESEDNYQFEKPSDKSQKRKRKGQAESEENYDEFASPEFADLPMN